MKLFIVYITFVLSFTAIAADLFPAQFYLRKHCAPPRPSRVFVPAQPPTCATLENDSETQSLLSLVRRSINDSIYGLEYDLDHQDQISREKRIEVLSIVLKDVIAVGADEEILDELLRLGAKPDYLVPAPSCSCTSANELALKNLDLRSLEKFAKVTSSEALNSQGETVWDGFFKSITIFEPFFQVRDLEGYQRMQSHLKLFDLFVESFPEFKSSRASPLEFWAPEVFGLSSQHGCHFLQNPNLLSHDYWTRLASQMLRRLNVSWINCLQKTGVLERVNSTGARPIHLLFSDHSLANISPSTLADFLDFCLQRGVDLRTPDQQGRTPRDLLLKTAFRRREELAQVFNERGIRQ